MAKKKQSLHRSKLRQERELNLRNKIKIKQKKKFNEELFEIVNTENIDGLDVTSKKEIIMKLFNLIISFPNENYDKINLLLIFLQDKNIKIVLKSMRLLTKLFIDILPSYRIREDQYLNKPIGDNINNNGKQPQKLSKEVEKVQSYEKCLLKYYEKFVNILEIFTKNSTPDKKTIFNALQEFSIKILGELIEKFYLFNCSEKIYKILIETVTDYPQNIKKSTKSFAYKSLSKVLSVPDNTKNMLQLKLDIIKLICHFIFTRPHENFPENILDLFLAHRIDFPDLVALRKAENEKFNLHDIKFGNKEKNSLMSENKLKTKQQERIERRDRKKHLQEKAKIVKDMRKDMNEYETQENPRLIYTFNLKMLKKILLVYLDILKFKQDSPLIKSVLYGIGQLCENINVEILIDIQKCVHDYIIYLLTTSSKGKNFQEEKKLFAITAIKTILIISAKLTKDIINIEDTKLINSTYAFLQATINITDKISIDDAYCILEVLEIIFIKNRQYSLETVGSFIKRIAIFVNSFDLKSEHSEKFCSCFLLILKRIIQRYPNLNGLLINDEDLFDFKMIDPALCNGKQSNIFKEITSVKAKFKDVKLIRNMCDYILNSDKINPIFQSMNYFEMLVK